MKKYLFGMLLSILTFSLTSQSFAQSPEGINYQAVARDNNGDLIKNTTISVKAIVLAGQSASKKVYEETHNITTNDFGHFNLVVGDGSSSDDFSSISWNEDPHHLKIELDLGSGYVVMGTVQLQSVPYALHSKTAETVTNLNLDLSTEDLSDVNSSGAVTGNVLKWNGSEWTPAKDNNTIYLGSTSVTVLNDSISAKYDSPIWNATKIRNIDVASGSPTKDQVLQYDGSEWTYATLSSGGGSSALNLWDTVGNNIYFMKNNGNVGINTATPNTTLAVFDSVTSTANIFNIMTDNYCYGGSGIGGRFVANRSVLFGQGGGSNMGAMNIAAGDINSGGEAVGTYSQADGDGAYNTGVFGLVGEDASSQSIAFFGNARANSSFNVGLYANANKSNSGTNYGVFSVGDSGSTNYAGYFLGNVNYTGNLTNVSDAKLKYNVNNLGGATALIMQLQPKTYFYKQDGDAGMLNLSEGKQYGFIAQELEEVIPEVVTDQVHMVGVKSDEKMEYKAVNYIALIPVLTQALKEQQETIELLEKRIAELEEKNN